MARMKDLLMDLQTMDMDYDEMGLFDEIPTEEEMNKMARIMGGE